MAVIPLNPTTFTLVDEAVEPVMVQFTGPGAIQVAQSADPADGDWITMDTNRAIEFPAGAPIYARAPNGGNVRAITRPFDDDAGPATPRLNATISPDPVVAGQPFTITFEDEPETVTVTQDGVTLDVAGTGLSRTAIAPDVGVVTIDARKDGFRRFYATRDVVATPPVPVAPNVDATASISATGTVLDGPLDTVKGYPAPEPAFQWFDGDEAIPGATAKSYDHGGTDGAYRRQTTWTNGVGDPAVSTSNTITIAPAPGIEVVSLTPNPMVAGQPFTIVFNTTLAANEVTSSVTLSGTGDTRAGTAPADDTVNVSISATRSGWRPFSQAYDVAPAPPQLINQNNQLVLRNVTSNTAPFQITITEPAVYAGTYTITPAEFVAGPIWLVPSEISRSGDVITLRRGLPIWLEAMEPVVRRIEWLRGATFGTATVIEGADDQTTYTVNPSLDGGGNIWAREVIEDNSGREIASVSNAIPVAAPQPASWYHPDALVQIDYAGNRARINGTTYDSISAARTAGAIVVNSHGSDTVSFTPDAAWAMAARGITHSANPTSAAAALLTVDDGDDGNALDALVCLAWLMDASQPFLTSQMYSGGVSQLAAHGAAGAGPSVSAIVPVSTPVRAAINVETNNTITSIQGATRGTDTSCVAPAVTTIVVGNRSDGARAWRGTIEEILIINGAKTGADLEGLLA